MKSLKESLIQLFLYKEQDNNYNFILPENSQEKKQNKNSENVSPLDEKTNQDIYNSLNVNIDYIKVKYNTLINSDIILREFNLNIKGKDYKALLLFIDGMIDSESINNFILKPLMLNHTSNSSSTKAAITNNISVKRIKKFSLEDYIYNTLIPQNTMKKEKSFKEVFSGVNIGNCALFIDTLNVSFIIDVKGFESRSISEPKNEIVVRGSQESFVEKLRTNTSMLRRLIDNENLIIENTSVGKVSKTKIAICYMNNIANNDLVAEVKYRVNNLNIDNIISSGQLEQLIQDNGNLFFPQIIASERPDKAANHLLEGRVVIIVSGSPYCLIMPGVFIDFLASPEDVNLKFQYANLLKTIRIFALLITLFLPGAYVAITNYHTELLPTELLFTIASSRNAVPFPVIFEILLMELSFELIREAGLRVPTPIGPTIRYCWCFNSSEKQQ
ncbi:MAG: spore germination protein [Clostridia bacterium]|nr:spore germination protein [Clostridia bacterium]